LNHRGEWNVEWGRVSGFTPGRESTAASKSDVF